jgi:hypothetical protein
VLGRTPYLISTVFRTDSLEEIMSTLLLKAGPAIAAVLGILAFVMAFLAHSDAFLLSSSIFFGSAIIAAALGRIADKIGT